MGTTFDFSTIFPNLPKDLREELAKTYEEVSRNYSEGRHEPSELNGAKFSEVVFRVLEWHTTNGKEYTPLDTHVARFSIATKKFENMSNFPDSVRFHIPGLIAEIYSLRNKRGVGHVGGDINPKIMDSTLIVSMVRWVLAELVRIFHSIHPSDAQKLIETLVAKDYPIVWGIGSKKRVLDTTLNFEQKTLVLLYAEYPNPILEKNLREWAEYSNPSVYRKKILENMHSKKLLEYEQKSGYVTISPKGLVAVETSIELRKTFKKS